MDRLLDADFLIARYERFQSWLFGEVLSLESLVQLLLVGASYGIALWAGPRLGKLVVELARWRAREPWLMRIGVAFADFALPIVWLLLAWMIGIALSFAGIPDRIIRIAVSLLTAWVVIGLVSQLFRDRLLSKSVAVIAWTIAALNIVGILDATIAVLDSAAIIFGTFRLSALTVMKGVLALAILLWAATVVAGVFERRIQHAESLTPSVRVLFTKLVKVLLIAIAVVAALQSIGMDLSAFTVFTGALGVGLGFGLQKSVSNLFAGVMILMDRSIKPGDVIEVGGTYGWVNALSSRYVSVATRDGVEHLIPNEDFITQRVANWSYSSIEVRLKASVAVAYATDLRQAVELCIEVARETERVLQSPAPACLVKGFGDNGIELELRFWIADPRNGVGNVKSAILLNIWDKFRSNGIEFPYPQRDLHVRSAETLRVTLQDAGAS